MERETKHQENYSYAYALWSHRHVQPDESNSHQFASLFTMFRENDREPTFKEAWKKAKKATPFVTGVLSRLPPLFLSILLLN